LALTQWVKALADEKGAPFTGLSKARLGKALKALFDWAVWFLSAIRKPLFKSVL
jgi:hypothetical protein